VRGGAEGCRKIAGIDGLVVLLWSVKIELANWVQRQSKPWHARPVKRVYIAKAGGRRPFGIPVIVDKGAPGPGRQRT